MQPERDMYVFYFHIPVRKLVLITHASVTILIQKSLDHCAHKCLSLLACDLLEMEIF